MLKNVTKRLFFEGGGSADNSLGITHKTIIYKPLVTKYICFMKSLSRDRYAI